MTTRQEKVFKIVTKVNRHARSLTFQLAEFAGARELCEMILKKIDGMWLLTDEGVHLDKKDFGNETTTGAVLLQTLNDCLFLIEKTRSLTNA